MVDINYIDLIADQVMRQACHLVDNYQHGQLTDKICDLVSEWYSKGMSKGFSLLRNELNEIIKCDHEADGICHTACPEMRKCSKCNDFF